MGRLLFLRALQKREQIGARPDGPDELATQPFGRDDAMVVIHDPRLGQCIADFPRRTNLPAATASPGSPKASRPAASASFPAPKATPRPPTACSPGRKAKPRPTGARLRPTKAKLPAAKADLPAAKAKFRRVLAKVADAAKTRGGGEAVKDLETTANDLRAAAEEREATGTQLSTEQMDVIDGIIVTLCRSARNAARNVTTQPALAKAFALNHLAPPPPRDDEETPPAP